MRPLAIPLDSARIGGASITVKAGYELLDEDEKGALLRIAEVPQAVGWLAPGDLLVAAFDRQRKSLKAIRKPEEKDRLRFHRGHGRLYDEERQRAMRLAASDEFLRQHGQLMALIRAQHAQSDKAPPVVPLDAYFDGNSDEESIAPNQWGYGRPPLAQLWERLRTIAQRPDVQVLLVGIHDEWQELAEDFLDWPPAENVHIYTRASAQDAEQWIEGLEADGVVQGWPCGRHPAAPEPLPGYAVLTVCWD
jgi:hypothetical protein